MSQIYRLHDSDPGAHGGAKRISIEQAQADNKLGFGIFWTINEFSGARKIENLTKINCWAIDIDEGTKQEMLFKIKSGLVPSLVVETKRGFHVYFFAKDAKPEHWNSIVLDRLIPFYGADKRARDMARILRMPGFYHMKDPANPFLIEKLFNWNVSYTEKQMAGHYADKSQPARENFVKRCTTDNGESTSFWEKVWRIDCHEALAKLSGSDYVGGEIFSFQQTARGNLNIFVNNKSTSTWIDREGRIGSYDKGGPTIAQWLKYYGHEWSEVVNIIKTEFYEETKNGTEKNNF